MFVRGRDEALRPARTRGGRVIVITSLVALGAIALATLGRLNPDDDRTTATPTTEAAATSEPTTTTEQPATTTGPFIVTTETDVAVDPRPTGYIAERLPVGFAGVSAYNTPGDASVDAGSWIEVWATPDASRTAGRWLALSTSVYANQWSDPSADGVERVLVGDHYALRRIDADGVAVLTVTTDDQRTAILATRGLADDQLAGLVDVLSIDDVTGRPNFPGSTDAFDGLDLILSRATDQAGLDGVNIGSQREADYRSADGSIGFSVRSGPQRVNDLVLNQLLFPPSPDPAAAALAPDRIVDLAGHSAIVGSVSSGLYISQFVMWHDGTSTVIVSADAGLSLAQLLDIATAVRPSNADEWLTLLRTKPDHGDSSVFNWNHPDGYTTVGTVTTASQATWTIGLAVTAASKPPSAGMIWGQVETSRPADTTSFSGIADLAFPVTLDQPQSLNTYRFIDATLLVATVDAADTSTTSATAVALRVRLPGLEPVEIPLVPVPNSTISGAAYAFSQVGEYSADLVDSAGHSVSPVGP